jgi:hypothetical protein
VTPNRRPGRLMVRGKVLVFRSFGAVAQLGERCTQPLVARDAEEALQRLYRAWGKPALARRYAPAGRR